jgi:hypothetical protein
MFIQTQTVLQFRETALLLNNLKTNREKESAHWVKQKK